jgi:hypothetical protein
MLSRFSPFSGNLVKEALTNAENETSVRNLFNSLDTTKSSMLEEDELKKFTEGLLKINPRLTALNLDIETLNRRIFRLADRNNTGHLSYSDFHSLILNRCVRCIHLPFLVSTASELMVDSIKTMPDDRLNFYFHSNAHTSPVKVSLLEKPFAWATSKTVLANIDRSLPLKNYSLAIHSLLLPNEVCPLNVLCDFFFLNFRCLKISYFT